MNEGKNAQRDLVRKLMKGSKWPPLYAAKIPVLHQKTHQVLEGSINMLLPQEILAKYRVLQIDCFVIDWLRACDLGVAQDFLGKLILFPP